MTDIKKGDRVRVVIEGEVDRVGDHGKFRVHVGGYQGHDEYGTFTWAHPSTATIEKVEPPVEVFKPGDVVRALDQPDYVYLVRPADRYIYLRTPSRTGLDSLIGNEFGPMGPGFTSEDYERVDLG